MFRMPASREFAINPDDETTVRRGTETRVGDRRIPVVLLDLRSQVSFLLEVILPIVYVPIFLFRRNLEMIVRDGSHMP
jgi:hypothetical protein